MKKPKYAKIVGLLQLREDHKDLINKCSFCNRFTIDHDNVPENIIVDYDDRQIISETLTCEICGSNICRECATLIEDTWDVFYICPDCIIDHKDLIEKIKKLQERSAKILNKLDEAIYKLRNKKSRRSCGRVSTSRKS